MMAIPFALIAWGFLIWGIVDVALFLMKEPW